MTKKQRGQKIEEAIRLIWDSLQSHLQWTHTHSSEGEKFHKQCVKEYAILIKLLADLY
jgi:hypothetical protein